MKNSSTTEDLIRLSFVDSLYKQLRQQTKNAIQDHDRMVSKASLYLEDGLSESECSELLVIDGITREAAASYVQLAQENNPQIDGRHEYSFQFEDVYGKRYSSYDIGKTIRASSDEDAINEAERFLGSVTDEFEFDKIVSVTRIS